jgi:hypothetical protein
MAKLSEIPTDEMIKDRSECVSDIDICTRALAMNITHHRDGLSVQYRIDANRKMIEVIDAELERRKVELVTGGGGRA